MPLQNQHRQNASIWVVNTTNSVGSPREALYQTQVEAVFSMLGMTGPRGLDEDQRTERRRAFIPDSRCTNLQERTLTFPAFS